MITPEHFADIQQALIVVFAPFIQWGWVFMVAGSIFLSIGWFWLGMLRRLAKGGGG